MKNNQMLETDRSPNGIPAVCGVVKFAGRDYGFLTSVEGTEKDVWFSRNNVCGVRAGGSNPLLVDGDGQVPLFPGTVVVLLEPFDNGRGGLMTDGLCRKVAFDGVSREIANRPYYRLWHSANRWANGKFIASGNQPYAEETLESLEAKFPRGVQNDPLAPGYATGPVKVAAVKWEKRTPTGGWEICEDPRPLPAVLDDAARALLQAKCSARPDPSGWSPDSVECISSGGGRAIIRTYAGDVLNRTLARLIEHHGYKVSGNYADVTVEKGPKDPDELRDALWQILYDVAGGDDGEDWLTVLHEGQNAWPFSPFASMLSDELTRAALVDQTTDLHRLQSFLASRVEGVPSTTKKGSSTRQEAR